MADVCGLDESSVIFRLLERWHVSGFSTHPLLWLKMWPETWPKWNLNRNWILNYKMASLWMRACWWSPHQYLCSQRQFYAVVHHICSTEKIYCHSLETIWRKPWWMWISVRVPLVDWGRYNGDVFFLHEMFLCAALDRSGRSLHHTPFNPVWTLRASGSCWLFQSPD